MTEPVLVGAWAPAVRPPCTKILPSFPAARIYRNSPNTLYDHTPAYGQTRWLTLDVRKANNIVNPVHMDAPVELTLEHS